MATANPTAIFILVPVNDAMATILNVTVAAIGRENAPWGGFFGGLADDSIHAYPDVELSATRSIAPPALNKS
jgi:hypothetical protein